MADTLNLEAWLEEAANVLVWRCCCYFLPSLILDIRKEKRREDKSREEKPLVVYGTWCNKMILDWFWASWWLKSMVVNGLWLLHNIQMAITFDRATNNGPIERHLKIATGNWSKLFSNSFLESIYLSQWKGSRTATKWRQSTSLRRENIFSCTWPMDQWTILAF